MHDRGHLSRISEFLVPAGGDFHISENFQPQAPRSASSAHFMVGKAQPCSLHSHGPSHGPWSSQATSMPLAARADAITIIGVIRSRGLATTKKDHTQPVSSHELARGAVRYACLSPPENLSPRSSRSGQVDSARCRTSDHRTSSRSAATDSHAKPMRDRGTGWRCRRLGKKLLRDDVSHAWTDPRWG